MHGTTGVAELEALIPLIRRVAVARLRHFRPGDGANDVDDVVQETLERMVTAVDRLASETLAPYAVVTVRNIVISRARHENRNHRYYSRLVDDRTPSSPEEDVLREEEHRAVREALGRLPPRERRELVAHELEGASAQKLAEESGTTPGNVRVRLARGRARLRAEYILASSRIEPPTPRCRPVLYALSAGDRTHQRALDVGSHLLGCRTCAGLAGPLVGRRRRVAAIVPGIPSALLGHLDGSDRKKVATAVVLALILIGLLSLSSWNRREKGVVGPPSSSSPPCMPREIVPGPPEQVRALAGCPVSARALVVHSVVAKEGFWVGTTDLDRLWVQLTGPGESPAQVVAGSRVSFDSGVVVTHGPGFATTVGVDEIEGAGKLDADGVHVEVGKTRIWLA